METIPFVDLKAQYATIRGDIRDAIDEVLDSTQFILGSAVERFEAEFAEYLGVRHAVGVGSGLDALRLAIEACHIGASDEVIIPANTYIATALAVSQAGATPVLVDCRSDTYEIDPDKIEAAITPKTRALMPVHLYGQSADMEKIATVAAAHGLDIIEDAAQAHGTRFDGTLCGTMGRAGCFSFYPGKNLGAYGDGGLVATNDDDLADTVRRLRNYGQREKYHHVEKGGNSRLDSLQAAVLSVKLRHLDGWNGARSAHAAKYSELLAGSSVVVPYRDPRSTHVYHLYVVRTSRRDELQRHLAARGIQTVIHYPIPIHVQDAYSDLGVGAGAFPVTEHLAGEILSLPMFAEMTDEQIRRVADAIIEFE